MKAFTLDNREITDIIYDTLFKNKQWPQLHIGDVERQHVKNRAGYIEMVYKNKLVQITVESKPIE